MPGETISLIEYGAPPNGINTHLRGLSRTLKGQGIPSRGLQRFAAVRMVGRVLGKLEVCRPLWRKRGEACLVSLAWPNDGTAFPYSLRYELAPWVCDCWPRSYPQWERLFRRHRVRLAFFSAEGAAEHFREKLPRMRCLWMPEACDPSEYDPGKRLVERSIDVLEIGRKHGRFHQAVAEPLREAGRRHVFSREVLATRVFADQASLYAGMGDSVVSVCFPRVDTHPELAGGLETVTLRYFESIASGCIVLGRCPAELAELFGYNPVIEVDWRDPWGQLKRILDGRGEHQALVDRNLARLREVGTWEVRSKEMVAALEMEGWVVPRRAK